MSRLEQLDEPTQHAVYGLAGLMYAYMNESEIDVVFRNVALLSLEAQIKVVALIVFNRMFPLANPIVDDKYLRYIVGAIEADLKEINQAE